LPVSENQTPSASSIVLPKPRMPIRVLIVENEQSIADTLLQILHAHGYDTSFAYKGGDSISLLNSFRPDVLVSDLLMPGISGMEVAPPHDEVSRTARCR
jgi:CheY-like chemotaxis protein